VAAAFLVVGLLSLVLVNFMEATGVWLLNAGMSQGSVSYLLSGDGWRLMMIAGAFPALLVFFIRLFVPESHKWEAERKQGATSHWATRDLLGVVLGAIGAVAVIAVWSPFFKQHFSTAPTEGADSVISNLAQFIRPAVTALGLCAALLGFLYPVLRYLGRAEYAGRLQAGDRNRYVRRMRLIPDRQVSRMRPNTARYLSRL
jgi:MFS transporter, SHS family, sialic acid transporter